MGAPELTEKSIGQAPFSPDMKSDGLQNVVSHGDGQVLAQAQHATVQRNIKSRHAQMMAIGGAIGTSYFLATGQALAAAGPAFLFASYVVMSCIIYGVVTAVIEITTYMPVPGASIAYYCSRFISPSLGFAMGWLYFYSFGIIVAYEITAANILIDYWPNTVHPAVWITLLMIIIIGLNFCPVGVYAETEFWFAGIKIVMILGLLILSFILCLGGAPEQGRLGFRYWQNPGAVKAYIIDGVGGRFTAFLYVWVFSAFSFNFSAEFIVYTSGEMRNPRKNLPIAARRYFVRMVVFYLLGTLAIGVICPSNAKGLTSGTGNANASPWVIAIRNAGIPVLPAIINAGILTSAWSAGNSYLYMSSRALFSLSIAGNAPRIFQKCNRWGVPVYAVLAASCFAPLAYLQCGSQAGVVFNWFVSLTNTAGYTSWVVCCILYLRFRKSCQVQGISLPYRSRLQPWMSWICLPIFFILLLCNGFTVFYPGEWVLSYFLTTYLGIPIFLAFFFGHKLLSDRRSPWYKSCESVDLLSGLDLIDATQEHEETESNASRPWQKNYMGSVANKVKLLWE